MYEFLACVKLDFTNRDTGERIEGYQLWFLPFSDTDRGFGRVPEKKWVSPNLMSSLGGFQSVGSLVGSKVDVLVDLRGRLSGIKVVK